MKQHENLSMKCAVTSMKVLKDFKNHKMGKPHLLHLTDVPDTSMYIYCANTQQTYIAA